MDEAFGLQLQEVSCLHALLLMGDFYHLDCQLGKRHSRL